MLIGIEFDDRQVAAACWQDGGARYRGMRDASVSIHRNRVVVGDRMRAAHQPDCVASDVFSQLGEAKFTEEVDGRTWRVEALAAAAFRAALQLASRDRGPEESMLARPWSLASPIRRESMHAAVSRAAVVSRVAVAAPWSFNTAQRSALRESLCLAAGQESLPIRIVSRHVAALAGWVECQGRREMSGVSPTTKRRLLHAHLGPERTEWAVAEVDSKSIVVRSAATIDRSLDGVRHTQDVLAEHVEELLGEPPFGLLNERHWRLAHATMAERLHATLQSRESAPWALLHAEQCAAGWLDREQWEPDWKKRVSECAEEIAATASKEKVDGILLTGRAAAFPDVRLRIGAMANVPVVGSAEGSQRYLSFGCAALAPEEAVVKISDLSPWPLGVQTIDRKTKRAFNKVVFHAGPHGKRGLKIGQIGESPVTVRLLQGEHTSAEKNMMAGDAILRPDECQSHSVHLRLGYDAFGELAAELQLDDQEPTPLKLKPPNALGADRKAIANWLAHVGRGT